LNIELARRIHRDGGQPHLSKEPKLAAARSTASRRRRRGRRPPLGT
jgi:hypothetical protein